MLKLISRTRNVFSKHLLQSKRLFSWNNHACRQFTQLNGQTLCTPQPRLSNASQVMMSSSVTTPKTKMTIWGISGAVILISMIAIDKSCILLVTLPLLLFNRRKVYVILKMLPRDVRFLKRYLHSVIVTKHITAKNWTVPKLFKEKAKEDGNAMMMVMDGQEWKYKEVNSYANRVSRLFQKHKLSKGDVVCVMLNNSPEMISIIIGLTQIGVICSLINFNLVSHGLKHCIDISKCSFLITDSDHVEAVEEIRSTLSKDIKMYQFNDEPKAQNYLKFEEELYKESDEAPEVIVTPSHDDPMIYIYTSGTSGIPKAAIIPHSKFLVSNLCSVILLGLNKKDKVYNPLPLYHTTGLIVGAGACITCGIPVVIRKKFSSHFYFPDCIKYKCSLGMYIGEICRYIFMVPPAATDRKHSLKLMLGNGMSNDLWKKFQERFNVKMTELYGSTEGNCNMINIDGKVGAVGFLPTIVPFFLYPYFVIRIDPETLEPIRGSNGLCIKCDYNEPGMLVGRIREAVESRFHGYVSKEDDTKSKIIRNVFKKGDRAFVTGDILMVDEYLYFYFKDRTGDTFRWKGENVSTAEVEGVVAGLTHKPCACFGVKLKGYDGYAGMVCIEDPEETVDLNKLLHELIHHLPKYSVPRFIRIVTKIQMTSTHKIIKKNFAIDGINLDVIKDKVYYLDNSTITYEPLTQEIIKRIEEFKIAL